MSAASLKVFHWFIIKCLGWDHDGTVAVVQAVALLVSQRRIIGIETKSSIERLSPCIGLAIVAEGEGVWSTASHFLNVANPIDQCWYIARSHFWVSCSQLALVVASHGVYISSVSLNEHCVLLTTAHIGDHNVEGTNLGEIMNDLFATDAQLAIVVIYMEKLNWIKWAYLLPQMYSSETASSLH